MMAKAFLCFLLVLGSSLAEKQQNVLKSRHEDYLIESELNTTLEDGRKVQETSATDRDCTIQVMTSKVEDNTTSVLINDLDDDKGLVLFPDSPGVCYVRSLKGKKNKCNGGYETPQGANSSGVVETRYVDGAQLRLQELPRALQEVCENKTVIKLVEKTDQTVDDVIQAELQVTQNDADAEAEAIREKRARKTYKRFCTTFYEKVCESKQRCKHCCRGWFWGKRCSNSCCSTYTDCKNVRKSRCQWRWVYV